MTNLIFINSLMAWAYQSIHHHVQKILIEMTKKLSKTSNKVQTATIMTNRATTRMTKVSKKRMKKNADTAEALKT